MCIDPQQQALNWIKKKEENNNLKVQKVPCLYNLYVNTTHKSQYDIFRQLPTADRSQHVVLTI